MWFKVDDGFVDHPKTEDLPDSAVALWTRAGAWSSRHLTDGFIAARKAHRLCDNPDEAIKALLLAGLWIEEGDGYRFHDWIEYQPSRAEAIEAREAESHAGRRGNHLRWHVKKGVLKSSCPFCQDGMDIHRVPDRVGDLNPSGTRSGGSSGTQSGLAIPPSRPVPSRPVPMVLPPEEQNGDLPPVGHPPADAAEILPLPLPAPAGPRKPRTDTAAAFDRFWAAYPRKTEKIDARRVFDRIVKANPELAGKIVDGAVRLRDDPNRDPESRFTKHPATWLNKGCWDDDPLPPRFPTIAADETPPAIQRAKARTQHSLDLIKFFEAEEAAKKSQDRKAIGG